MKKQPPVGLPLLEETDFPVLTAAIDADRITVILPVSLLMQVEARIALLRKQKKVSKSGYIEAALRELLAKDDGDLEILNRHGITARRVGSKSR